MRTSYTSQEDEHLLEYIAEVRPLKPGRQGQEIYKTLVANLDKWPWARTHSWQGWRDHYKANQDFFDERITKYQRRQKIDPRRQMESNPPAGQKTPFTDDEDKLLVKYLARHHPQLKGRSGNQSYKKLTENAEGKWNWSRIHPWQSWRSRYRSNQERFDREIEKYQARHNISIPALSSQVERPAKRLKVMVDDSQESEWAKLGAKLDRISRRDPVPSGNTARDDEQEERKPVIVDKKKLMVMEKRPSVEPPLESTTADEDQADESDDGGGPPASDDYIGEIFPDSDKDEKGGKQVSATEDEDEEMDSGAVGLNGTTSTPASIHEKPTSNTALTIFVPSQPKSEIQPDPVSPQPLPKPSQPKPRVVPSYNDFMFGSQYKRHHPHPNDDPFEDYQSPPKSARKTQVVEKSPPKLVEGPFGNRLSRAPVRKLADNSTESEIDGDIVADWPPPRGTTKMLIFNGAQARPKKPRGGYINGMAREQPRLDKGKGKAREYDESDSSPEEHGPAPPVMQEQEPDSRQAISAPLIFKTTTTQGPQLGPRPNQTLKRRRTDIFLRPSSPAAPTPKRYSTGDITDHPPSIHPPPPAVSTSINPRIINFRQELSNVTNNKLAPQRASSRSSHASSSVVSEEDHQLFQQLGIQQAMRILSEQFGFTEAIVQKLWNQLKSLRLLKDALTEMRDSADRTMKEWIEGASRVESEGVGAGGQSPFGSGVFQVAARPRTMATPSMIMTTPASMINISGPSSSRRHSRGRQSVSGAGMKTLEIKPVDAQDVSVAMELEYEPLMGTRAGKYTRLAKMGREDEALEREQRRVSSIALSPRRDLLQQEEQGQGREQAEEHDVEREEVEDIVTETRDEDEEIQDEDDAHNVHSEGEGRDNRSDEQNDHAMEVDSTLPDVHEQLPATHPERGEHSQEREHNSEDRREVRIVHEARHTSSEPQPEVESVDEGDQTASDNTNSPRTGQAKPPMQTDCERWKAAEPYFRAANRGNIVVLKELERTFHPGFLLEWLSSLAAPKQL